MVRSILGVVAGFVLWSVLWLGLNQILHATGMLPTELNEPFTAPVPLLLLLAGSVLFSLVSGCTAAFIAGPRPAWPVLILGLILLAVGVAVQVAIWDKIPLWYHVPFLALLVPATLVGGRIRPATSAAKA